VKQNDEFDRFDRTMRDLMKVPHEEIKAELDREKAARKPKKEIGDSKERKDDK